MGILIGLIAIVASLVSLGCWIYTIVVAFQNEETALGIFSICPIVGFVIGWMKSAEWNHQNVMIIWSICFVLNISLQFAGGMGGLIGQ